MGIRDQLIASIRRDYRYMDGVETLTYTVAATNVTYTGVKGVNHDSEQTEIRGTLKVKKTYRIWEIFAYTMPSGVEPAPGDWVTDGDNQAWIFQEWKVTNLGLQNVAYNLKCVRKL